MIEICEVSDDLREWPFWHDSEFSDLASVSISLKKKMGSFNGGCPCKGGRSRGLYPLLLVLKRLGLSSGEAAVSHLAQSLK